MTDDTSTTMLALIGNLTDDPELQTSNAGNPWLRCPGLATRRDNKMTIGTSTRLSSDEEDEQLLTQLRSEMLKSGRNQAPWWLWGYWKGGEMWKGYEVPLDILRQLLPDAWSASEWPGRTLKMWVWLAMFKEAGFVSDCGSPAPVAPLVLYRGATPSCVRGFSWTKDIDVALRFARRNELFGFDEAAVYEVTVPPHAVLAHIMDRSEDEVVLNPHCLRGRAAPKLLSGGTTASRIAP
jgi:hypothetical protein